MKKLLGLLLCFSLVACAERPTTVNWVDDNSIEDSITDLQNRVLVLEEAAANNLAVYDVIDPCGDGPGVDEVLLVTNEGVMAWYSNVGLVLLSDGSYITTDSQGCGFVISQGTVL